MTIEKMGGVSSKERSQADRTKTSAEQYAEHHKLNDSSYVSTETTEDRGSGKIVKLLE